MITTNDHTISENLNVLRNHGASLSEEERHVGSKPFLLPDFKVLGYNYRMTDIQGAVGLVQVKKLLRLIDERDKWANYYIKKLSGIPWLNLPKINSKIKHGWQSFVLMVDEKKSPMTRNQIMEHLMEKGISTRPGTHAIHMLDYYKDSFKYKPDDFPNAKNANDFSIAIPLHNKMVKDDYEFIVKTIRSI